jgi:hypothetical protein
MKLSADSLSFVPITFSALTRNCKLRPHDQSIIFSSQATQKHEQTMAAFDATDKKYQISQDFPPDKESTWTHPPEKDGKWSGGPEIVATV